MNRQLAAAAALLAPAYAQSLYGQCGGTGWTGGTTCPSGSSCQAQSQYYSQCLPGAAAPGTTLATSTVPAATSAPAAGSSAAAPAPSAPANVVGNPFTGKQIYANPYYASEISASAIPSLTGALKTAATSVANTGTFVWLDTAAKVPTMDTYLADIQKQNAAGANIIGQFVVYDLPDRDCAAAASNGEYSVANNGVANYKAYIDSIAAIVKKYPTVSIALIIEPDSLGNLITNMGVQKCANAADAYKTCIEYAISTLNIPNVSMYLDAGHSGWLGKPSSSNDPYPILISTNRNSPVATSITKLML